MHPTEFRTPVTLEGRYLSLAPLDRRQIPALAHAGRDPAIWRYLDTIGPGRNVEEMTAIVDLLLERQRAGTDLPFVVLLAPHAIPIGMTRFLDIDRINHNVEVGGTWYDSDYWRTPINTDAKLQMFTYAFEVERVVRVQLKTDAHNVQSQRAIERLGAVREGALRHHRILRDGTLRTSVYYSVLADEWPAVRARLESALERPWSSRVPPSQAPADAGRGER
jgi:N-acetyltransferase